MLKAIIREAKVGAALAKYPLTVMDRRSSWPVHAASGVKLNSDIKSQSYWAKSLLWFAQNDLSLY